MAVDTPATIAILGAGPVGIEAGLYARYLGYSVVILEQREVASHVLAWGHLQLLSPFLELRSSLGLAALRAQDAEYRPPESDARLTGPQWVDKYLLPLSRTDLLADEVRCHAHVVAVGRAHALNDEAPHDEGGDKDGFRILIEHANGQQRHERADIVIDCTGVFGDPNWCGEVSPERLDRVIADVGHQPDHPLYEGLLVSASPVPGALADRGEHPGDDAVDDDAVDDDAGRAALRPERLITPEPNFYILGAKRCGRDSRFLFTDGLRQIRDLFGIIGGRPALDLYATAEKLAQ